MAFVPWNTGRPGLYWVPAPSLWKEEAWDATSARDYFDYSAWDVKRREVLVKANAVGSLEDVLVKEGAISREWPEIGWVAATVPEGDGGVLHGYTQGLQEVLLVEPNLQYTPSLQREWVNWRSS